MTGAYRERSALPFVPRVSKVVPRHIQYRFTYVSAGPSLLVTIKEVCLLALSFERIQNQRDDNVRARSLDRWSKIAMSRSHRSIRVRKPAAGMSRFFNDSNRDRYRKLASSTISHDEQHRLLRDLAKEMDAFKREARCCLSPTGENGSAVPGSPDRT